MRVLADRVPLPSRFLIPGSASANLIKHASESLAGRVERITIGGFSLDEVGREYTQSFVERDLPLHGVSLPPTMDNLLAHPKFGASWEGFVIEEVIRSVEPHGIYFGATHQGAEIDLVFNKGGRMYGVEIKRADAPTMTPSMRIALEDLNLERIAVIYPGKQRYSIHKQVDVVPFDEILGGIKSIFG